MTAKTRFRGSFTALVTPFKNGSIDEKTFRELVDWQIAEGRGLLHPFFKGGQLSTENAGFLRQLSGSCYQVVTLLEEHGDFRSELCARLHG